MSKLALNAFVNTVYNPIRQIVSIAKQKIYLSILDHPENPYPYN